MTKRGKFFGIFNIIDLFIIFIMFLGILGLFLVKSGKFKTSSKVIKKEAIIEFDTVIRGQKLSRNENLFNAGEKTFITIRNVPYTSLKIIKAEKTNWQTVIPNPKNPSKAIAVDDPSEKHTYNFLITVEDKALITDDGPVIGGNKIKIGLPVSLEGYNYRVYGVVSDVRTKK
jgi:hypothetical protein